MGESGSGKSTLINLLAGLDVPDAGEIEVNRQRVSELDEAARARHRLEHVSVIFQDNNLIAEMTNIENVALPLWARGRNRAQGRRAAEDALARLGIDQLGDRRPSEVSGGQRQRVGVARALAGGQRVLLADEPTGALDSANSEELFKVFAALAHEQSMCVVVATHDPIAGRFCDSMTVLRDGEVVE
ncbi:MAG: ATP-binding cassette domain-containing protein [Cutibacterium avidum]|nr:ATP-binding cassette domain-containing protein [Cutibacterium avidum]